MRLDVYLTQNAYCKSRNKASEMIRNAYVKVDGKTCTKPSFNVNGAKVEVLEVGGGYVSRAAHKLDAVFGVRGFAADSSSGMPADLLVDLPTDLPIDHQEDSARFVDVEGKVCLDIGACTGGFTQVLLNRGAKCVVALDVGHGQLDASLLQDERVINLEGVNIRDVQSRSDFESILIQSGVLDSVWAGVGISAGASVDMPHVTEASEAIHRLSQFDVIVVDISFISVAFAIPAIKSLLKDDGKAIVLIKPQFEIGKAKLSKTGGVVKSERLAMEAVTDIHERLKTSGLMPIFTAPSPIKGTKGNQEYLTIVTKEPT
ncbi:MAG: TlyA family RNA methyltransferase [Candidatus Ancillula sp.]|jgi:23S rRNA (cytidine1920-2'-O)/16S rRNA (cytidine1409-2'-O)-methyltransferase|nr:TlyA family RNA methyltransferase [Candidatus Ancillula sp.]